MISTIKLKFGRTPTLPAEPISTMAVTVFVGPNNSGKSKVLSEIEQYCRTGNNSSSNIILDELTFFGLNEKQASEAVEHLRQSPTPGNSTDVEMVTVGRTTLRLADLLKHVENPNLGVPFFCHHFLSHNSLVLNGQNRIGLVNQQPGGDLQQSPQSSLQVLFRDDAKRSEVRRIVHDAFGYYFVIDPTNLGQLRIRLSQREPKDDIEEKGIHAEAVEFHAKAHSIDIFGDGVKAFTGIVTQVIAGGPRVLIVDEPEAFLHPSLALKLGNELSRAALTAGKRVFASTHSPNFVMGCIQSGAPINIIRLTYKHGVATARQLPSAGLLQLMRNPLLRSTGILSGLFYEFVVVTESDADRAFYQEANERLLRFNPEWGIPNCLFINAQNKQTIQTIIRPLRQLGIPAAGIIDVDVLKEGGTNWTNLLSSANIPPIAHGGLNTIRAALKKAMNDSGKDMKRDGGVDILQPSDKEAAMDLLSQLGEYGVFIVPGGELESWLKSLGCSGHGPFWLIQIFEKMGEDSEAPDYLKPSSDDVWQFMKQIKNWLVDSNRKGIPN